MRLGLCLNVRFWTESFEILRSQMCDPANEECIEWSDMNEAEIRVTVRDMGLVRPARFPYARPGSIEVRKKRKSLWHLTPTAHLLASLI